MSTSIGSIRGTLTLRDQFTGAMKRATSQLQQSGQKMERVGRRMSEVGSTLTRSVTLPLVAIGGAAVKSFADFDDAMNQSLAIMGDVSKALRDDMAGAARTVAKETVFSAEQAAESYFFLASAGLDAAQSIEAMPQVAAFAQAGMFDMARATDLLTDAQSALGLTVQDTAENTRNMARTSDVLVKANTLANASVEQFSTALTSKAGAALKSFDIAMEEGVAVLAAFADQGVKAELAGNSLDRILRLMPSAAIKNADAYREMGIQVFDSSGELRNMADILGDLEKALGGMGDEQKQAALEALGFQARVQGIIKPLLGTSDAIREYEKELRNAAGTTQEVADKQLESFKKQMGLVKDQLVDAAVTLGSELAPIIQDFAEGTLVPAIEKLADLAEGFGELERSTQGIIVAVGAAVAAFGPLLFVTGQLITAWGALAQAAPGVATAIAGVVSPVNAVAAAILGLVLVANEAVNRWRRSSEQGIAAIIAANNRAKESVRQLREELETGSVRAGTFQDVANRSRELEQAIARTKLDIRGLQRELNNTDWSNMAPDQAHIRQQELNEEIERAEDEVSNLESELVVVDKALKDVGKATIDWTDETEEANETVEGLNETVSEMSDQLKKALKNIEDQTEVNEALADALSESQAAYDKLNVLLEAGVPLAEALSGEYDALAEELIESREAVDELQESLRGLAAATSAGGPFGSLFDFARDMQRAAEIFGEVQKEDSGPVGIGPLPGVFVEQVKHAARVFGDLKEETEGLSDQFEQDMRRIRDSFIDGIQGAAADAFKDFVKTGELNFERLWDTFLDLALDAIAQVVAKWATTQFVTSVTGGAGAGAAGAAGSAAGGMSGSSMLSIAKAAWPLFAVAAGWIIGQAKVASTKAKQTGGTVHFGTPTNMGVSFNEVEGMSDQMLDVLHALQDTFAEIEHLTGTSIGILEQAVINVKNNGEIWVNIGERLSVQVKDMNEAMGLVVNQLLRTSEIVGGSDVIRAALENSNALSVEKLQEDIAAALQSEELFLGVEGRSAIRQQTRKFFDLLQKEIELGLIEAQGGSGALRGLVASYQQSFDQLMGVQRSAGEVARQQAKAHNAALKMDKARLLALRAEIETKGLGAKVTAAAADASGGHAEIMVQQAEVTQGAAKAHAGLSEVIAAGGEVTAAVAKSNAEALSASGQALAAIDEALLELEGLEVDLDKAAAAARRANAGGPSSADRLAEAMERIERSLMPSLARQMAELRLKYEELIQMAGKDAEALARLNDLRRQEAEIIRQQATEDLFGGIKEFERVDDSALRSGIRGVQDQGEQLRQQAEEWAAAMAESAKESGKFFDEAKRLEAALERIAEAERKRIRALVSDEAEDLLLSALDFLGRTEQAERLRFQLAQAEFQIRLQELKIAAKKHNIEIATLQEIGKLVGEITDLSFEDFQEINRGGPGGGGGPDPQDERDDARRRLLEILARSLSPFEQAIRRTVDEFAELREALGFTAEVQAAYAQEIQRVLREQLEPIRRLQEELNFRADAPMRTVDQFKLAQKNLNEALTALRGGDLSQIDKIPDLARRILDLNPAAQGSEGNRFIFELVNRALEEAQQAAEDVATGIEPGGPNDPFAWLRHTPTAGDNTVANNVRTMANRVVSSQDETTDAIKENTEEEKRKKPDPGPKVVDISGFRPAIMENLARRQNHILENVRGDLQKIQRNQKSALPK